MTRRIALAILVSACAMLIIGGVAAYVSVRQTLLAELDAAIIERATNVVRTAGIDGETETEPAVPQGDRYIIRSDRGHTIARPGPERPEPPRPAIVTRGFVATADGQRTRTMTLRFGGDIDAQPVTVVYSSAADRFDRTMHRLALTLIVVMVLGVGLTASVAVWVSGVATRPLQDTARTIGTIDERHLDRRINLSALPGELVPVATRLNEMLERLERALAQRRQFMIDAAHELRSPVAGLRTTLEVALQHPRDVASLTHTLERCLTSTRMLNRLADVLTEQLRGEADAKMRELLPINAGRLLQECIEALEPLAVKKRVKLVRLSPDDCPMLTDADRLRSIVMNLLSNAVEYTPADGTVTLELVCRTSEAVLRVSDSGPGISPEHLPHVFEPFYRADGSRGRGGEHLGLGLYLVRSHAEALGGSYMVQSNPGKGSTFTIVIPTPVKAPEISYSSHERSVKCAT